MDSHEIGPGWLTPYRNSEFRLRFELGGEESWQVDQPVPRFLQALDRSRQLADVVFGAGQTIAIVGSWKTPGARDFFHPNQKRGASGRALLKQMGFTGVKALHKWREKPWWADPSDPDDSVPFTWRAFDLTGHKPLRDTLLWAANAYEIGIAPKAPVNSYLFNPESKVVVYVYDDRGMDIMALSSDPLTAIYRDFNHWILDYDRPRIAEALGPPEL